MSKLNEICAEVYSEVDGAIAVAVVDLDSGMPLSVYHQVSHFDQNYVDLVSAAAVDMFRGKTVRMVEDQLTKQRNKSALHSIQEVQMTTAGTLHFMIVLPEHQHIVVVMVTSKRTSTGMGWASLRRAVPTISQNI
ncbi:hypothetical protein [Wielerella bovis]|uniref:hypothetical protein n=1 Tax=Wielerella bovis TaxID=2917790 RepID=UPI00201A06F4|nr:hypothetical protein [Wielerella bovis]ULJ60853.1 hypothetical protein MIS44_03035 [Wielerella bovis]